jgi:ABC-type Na+ efflux pump permease subunit
MLRIKRHHLLSTSGYLIKFFLMGLLGISVLFIFLGSIGANSLVEETFQTITPIVSRSFVAIICFTFISVVLESFSIK